jgi:hypothetical protein
VLAVSVGEKTLPSQFCAQTNVDNSLYGCPAISYMAKNAAEAVL